MMIKGFLPATLVLIGLVFSAGKACAQTSATPVRETDAVCAQCHETIFRNYLATPMANASGLAIERLVAANFRHNPSGVEYRLFTSGDSAWLGYQKLNDSSIGGKERLDYFLGSGHLGVTYLYSKNGYLLESPIAYYPDLKSYDMKPGLAKISHMPGALTINATCLRCHMSGVQRQDSGTENHYQALPFLHTGITCESCHGDTLHHVASKGTVKVVNPIKLDAQKRDSICIVCHLEGTTSVEHRGRSLLDFQPGQDVGDFVSYFTYASENSTHRGVSEIEQFTSSRCKRTSGAAMSCMNCHDPHFSPSPAERTAFYRSKCLVCHTAPKYATAHYTSNTDCTSCHMPKIGAKNIPHVAWTDHRLLQRPEKSAADAPGNAGSRELSQVANGSENTRNLSGDSEDASRDLALAYYNLAVNGNLAEKSRAISLLKAVARSSQDDIAVLRALAILAEWSGDGQTARQLYQAVLKQEPDSLTATVNLGTLVAKSGDMEAAAALWRPAFLRNEDVLGLGQNLATLECLLGEEDKAVETLQRVLLYSPDMPKIREKLIAIKNGSQKCPAISAPFSLTNP